MSGNYRYIRLADQFEKKIMAGDFTAGEKLPSIRALHRHAGLSITTVYQALIELEKRNLVETRPKSGFYVKPLVQNVLGQPELKKHRLQPHKISVNELASAIHQAMGDETIVQLGGAAPSPDLLPVKTITRAARSAINTDMTGTLSYGHPEGIYDLRRQIAKKMIGVTGNITADQIIVTNGCTDAVTLCLRAITDPGDTVALESPTFFGFLQLLEDLKLKALELPTHPAEGIDLKSLESVLETHSIKALLIIPNISNPLGYVMPEQKKRRLVKLLQRHNVPIVEDGIYSDLCFEDETLPSLKSYDRKDMVLYCSSFSKTLAPGLRMGWTVPGRFARRVRRLKMNSSIISPALNQQIAAACLKTGFYDRHVRKMKNTLKIQISNMAAAIAKYFPDGTKITQPAGGLLLWVQLHPSIDSFEIYQEALEKQISILPGFLCSSAGRHRNCIRLNCGFPWSKRLEESVKTLGDLIKKQIVK